VNAFATTLRILDPFVVALTGPRQLLLRFRRPDLPDYYKVAITRSSSRW